jgi:hypothetical protein
MSEVKREFITAAFGFGLDGLIGEIDGVVLVSHKVVVRWGKKDYYYIRKGLKCKSVVCEG